ATYNFSTSDFPFTNSAGTNFKQIQIGIVSGTSGTLLLNGTPVAANTVISAFDMATAHFTYRGPANVEKNAFTTFTFTGSDDGDISGGGSNTDTTPHTVTVSILPVNDAPSAKNTAVTSQPNGYVFQTTD